MTVDCLFVGQNAGSDLGKWSKHWHSVAGDN
jgi:hypothetical protein